MKTKTDTSFDTTSKKISREKHYQILVHVVIEGLLDLQHRGEPLPEGTWPFLDHILANERERVLNLLAIKEYLTKEAKEEGRIQAKQETLLLWLPLKFPHAPNSIEQTIRKTKDPARLDHWAEQVLFAETLDEIDF